MISHLKYFNQSSSINYEKNNYKNTDLEILFPEMKIQLKNLKKIYDISEKLWFWGAARKTVMFLHHFYEYYQSELSKDKFGCIDQNSFKDGKYIPSTKIKVIIPKKFLEKVKIKDSIIISNPFYENEIKNFLLSNLKFEPRIIIL